MLLLLACAADDFVALEPPRDGAQLHIEAFTVEAFAEVERCYWMDAGNAEGFVTAMELHARPGLHHAVVYNSEQPGSGVEDCFGLPEAAMEDWHDVPQPLFASSTQVNEQVVDFPEGVGVQLAENAGVLVNVHYLNATSEPLQAEVYVNLVIEDAVQTPAHLYAMGNLFDIRIPAEDSFSLTTSCPIDVPFTPLSMTPHMHQLGVGFSVSQNGEQLFSQDGWHPETVWFDDPKPLEVGTLELTCDWENPGTDEVNFGPGAGDEMCFVFGWASGLDDMYWQANYSGCEAL
jgi:hypothetical protein